MPKIFSLKNVLELHTLPWLFFSPPCTLNREPRCLGALGWEGAGTSAAVGCSRGSSGLGLDVSPRKGTGGQMRAPGPASLPPLLSLAFPFSCPSSCMRPVSPSCKNVLFPTPSPVFFAWLLPYELAHSPLPHKLRVAGTGSRHSSSSRSPSLPDPLLPHGFPSSQQGPSTGAPKPRARLSAWWRCAPERRAGAGPKRTVRGSPVPPEPCLPPQGSHCSSSGDPAEYNLRSRTVLCGTCGQPADKASAGSAGAAVGGSISSGSSASSVTVTRSYRSVGGSGGGSFGDNLVTRSYLLGNSSRRTQVSPRFACTPASRGRGSLRVRPRGPCGGGRPSLPQPGGVGASSPSPRSQLVGSCTLPLPSEPQTGGRGRGQGQGGGGHRLLLTPLPSPFSLSGPPELQHHVIWDLPGRVVVEASRFHPTSLGPPPCTSWDGA